MKNYLALLYVFSTSLNLGCGDVKEIKNRTPVNWQEKTIVLGKKDSLIFGSSYLSIYSEIYDHSDQGVHHLTATASMKNINSVDSVFILRADYYDTNGVLIRTYFDSTTLIKPLETIEIVIGQDDNMGGTGANFIFEWATSNKAVEPMFEAVMISTTGQQGISFTTNGIKR